MKSLNKLLAGGAMAGLALAGGAVGATMFGTAGAATNASTGATATAATSTAETGGAPPGAAGRTPDWSQGGHQANGKTETVLTGTALAKAKAAALAAVPGATAQRAETDAEGAAYEVHMTKSDGSVVTVKLDSNFKVTQTINGMG